MDSLAARYLTETAPGWVDLEYKIILFTSQANWRTPTCIAVLLTHFVTSMIVERVALNKAQRQ